MVVNSFQFLAFFIVVFLVYFIPWVRKRTKWQNVWLLLTSYFFYGFVDWKMLPILLAVTVFFYYLGNLIGKNIEDNEEKKASILTTIGVIVGIGILVYFKYLNFFAFSFAQFLALFGFNATWTTLNIVLPVGVSFFTFKLISYVIEVHREKIAPSRNFLEFATYIAFFPTILSGPIDRPGQFLPQLQKSRGFDFNLAMDGCQQILWGIFTKMVIADRLAVVTSTIWSDFSTRDSWCLIYAALLSPLQVYADFDGYSNMAIGVGKILGFRITKNFDHPLLARNVSEYWRRWHISLTGWITDYVFMPLNIAFRNMGKLGIYLAITINLIVIGMWHGANWTYAVFGLYHSLLFLPLILSGKFGKNKKLTKGWRGLPHMGDTIGMICTYLLIALGHIIFFSADLPSAVAFFAKIAHGIHHWESPFQAFNYLVKEDLVLFVWLPLLFITDWCTRNKEFPIQRKVMRYEIKPVRLLIVDLFLAMTILIFGCNYSTTFVYFQF